MVAHTDVYNLMEQGQATFAEALTVPRRHWHGLHAKILWLKGTDASPYSPAAYNEQTHCRS
eukprot:1158060-Pelagomonas_calceolata.AAC.5